jgi:hypothetical protein
MPYGRGVRRWRPVSAADHRDQIAPGLTERCGIRAVTAAQAIVSFSHPRTVPKRRRIRRAFGRQSTASQQRQDTPTSAHRPSRGRGQVQP